MAGRPQKHRENKTFIAKKLDELLAGESFAEFERKCQLPVTTIRRIMNGTDPNISTLTKIAKACNVTLDYFFEGGTRDETPSRSAPEFLQPVYPDSFFPGAPPLVDIYRDILTLQKTIADIGHQITLHPGAARREWVAVQTTVDAARDLHKRLLREGGAPDNTHSDSGKPKSA